MKNRSILFVPIIVCVVISLVYTASLSEQLWRSLRILDAALPEAYSTKSQESQTLVVHVDRILVVYSGPTELMDQNMEPNKISRAHKKMELYRLNFEFFLLHGIQCQTQDTLLVVTDVVATKYQAQIDKLHDQCHQKYGNFVRMITRNNTCYDLESVRVAIEYTEQGDRPAVMTNRGTTDGASIAAYYDYFVYINCGVTGPSPRWADRPWTNVFLQELRNGVKMTGLTMNCYFRRHPHVQSMMYAMDREGLQAVVDGGAIYDCTKHPNQVGSTGIELLNKIIWTYEIKLSDLILDAGYGISSVVEPRTLFRHNSSQCLNKYGNETLKDVWLTNRMHQYFGKVLSLDDVVFLKTSRILTPETANLINFTLKVDWNW